MIDDGGRLNDESFVRDADDQRRCHASLHSQSQRMTMAVRRKEQLAEEILPGQYLGRRRRLLVDAQEFRSKDLYRNYPPKFLNENKRFIFKSIYPQKKYSPAEDKSLLISRWYPIRPHLARSSPSNTEIHVRHDAFTYQPTGTHRAVEWHLNFANDVLFGFYAGDLLAQDELQVLECPELAALREYLVHAPGSVNARTVEIDPTRNQKLPTPSKKCTFPFSVTVLLLFLQF